MDGHGYIYLESYHQPVRDQSETTANIVSDILRRPWKYIYSYFILLFLIYMCLHRNGRNGSNTEPYSTLPAEAVFANSLGVLVVIFGLVVLKILFNREWKNGEFEQESERVSVIHNTTIIIIIITNQMHLYRNSL